MQTHVHYEDLIAFAADEIASSSSAAIAAHVANCSQCAATIIYFGIAVSAIRIEAFGIPSPAVIAAVYALFAAQTAAQNDWLASVFRFFSFAGQRLANPLTISILVTANVLFFGGAMILLSQDSVTGEILYPVKTTMENLKLAFTWTDVGLTSQQINLAGVRVQEMRVLAERQQYSGLESTSTAYQLHVQRAMDALQSVFRADAAQARQWAAVVNADLDQYAVTLGILMQSLPETIQPSIASAISASAAARHTLVDWQKTPPGSPSPMPSLTAAPSKAVTSSPRPVPTASKPVASRTSAPIISPANRQATATAVQLTQTGTPKNTPHGSPKTPGTPEKISPGQR